MRKFLLFAALFIAFFHLQAQNLTLTGKLNVARQSHHSAEIDANRILVFGGQYGDPIIPGTLASAELYNVSTGTWSMSYPMNHPRTAFTSEKINSSQTLVIGGFATVGYIDSAKVSCELLDHTTLKWSFTGNLNVARSSHVSVKLQSGKILVAGGGNEKRCELYDPATGKWTFTGSLNQVRQNGPSIVLLADGRALITGGSTIDRVDQNSAEIYDPVTESWSLVEASMNEFRYYHQSILLQDGRVFIVGGANHVVDDYLATTEYFDPTTFTFTPGPTMAAKRNASPLIRLANGDILTYGEGLFDLINTKCIEVYSNQTQTWIASSSTVLGSDFYTINNIGANGDKLLIAGGSSQTTIEPKDQSYIVNLPSCGSLVLNLTSSGNKICEGLNGTVTLKSSVSNIRYQIYKGDSPISSVLLGTGNDLLFPITPANLNVGLNSLTVKTSGYAAGCPFIPLADTAGITVTQSLTAPVITALGATEFCSGSSVNLMASPAFNSYIWSNGRTTQTVNITTTGTFTVKGKDASGCTTPSSAGTAVSFITAPTQAGANQIVCLTAAPFQLTGFSPAGGTWSGTGVTSNGMFNPSLAGLNTVTLTYRVCNSSATKTITVEGPPALGNFTIAKSGSYYNPTNQSFCQTSQIYHIIHNYTPAYSYQLRDSTGYAYPPVNAGSNDVYYNYFNHTTVLNVRESYTNSCGNFEYIRYDTLKITPWPVTVNVIAPHDTICVKDEFVFKIANSSPGLKYRIPSFLQYVPGNGDTLVMRFTDPIGYGASTYTTQFQVIVQRTDNYCPEMTAFDKPIVKFKFAVDFAADQEGYFLNDNQVKLSNKSNGNSYKWYFDNTASSIYSEAIDPPVYSYNSTGYKKIKLVANSKFCGVDSSIHYTNVYDASPSPNGNFCLLDTLSIKPQVPSLNFTTAFHTDKQNNSYVAGYYVLLYGDGSYTNGYGMYLHKYDASGKLIWKHTQSILDYPGQASNCRSSYINGITTDDNGNVYIAGSFSMRLLRYGALASDLRNGSPVETFIIKTNSSGVGQWMIFGKNPDEDGYSYNARGATDILYVDDEHIYVSLGNPKKMVFADRSVTDLGNNKLAILQINKDGLYKKQFDATTYSMKDWAYRYTPVNGGLNNDQKVAVSPNLKLSNDGRVFISGEFKDQLDFGIAQLNPGPTPTTLYGESYANFVAVLDTANGWQKAFITHYIAGLVSNTSTEYDNSKSVMMSKFALDNQNNIYITARYQGYFNLPSNGLIPADSSASMLAKFDENGTLIWYNRNTFCRPVGIAYANNQIISYGELNKNQLGLYSQSVTPKMIKGTGKGDIYFSSTSLDGNVNWINQIGSKKEDKAFFMHANTCDEINLIGLLGGRGGSNGDSIYYGNGNIFLARYSLTGNCQTVCNNATPPLKVSVSSLKEQDKINFSPIPLNFVFNREVSGFDASDVVVTGGTLSNFSGSGKVYTAQFTPSGNGSVVTITVPANAASDGSVQNIASTIFRVTYDNTIPAVNLTASLPVYFIKAASFTVTVDFSKYVIGFTADDFKLTNCKITNLTNSGYTNKQFIATVVPLSEGLLSIQIPAGIVADSADNKNTASTVIYKKYDITRPTVSITSDKPPYSKINSPVQLTITFSEYVSNMALSKLGGTSGFTFSNLSGDGKVFTATATPVQSGLLYFFVSNVADSSGNNNISNPNYYFQNDVTKPTVAITSSATPTTSLNPIPFTFVFSEPVNGFTASDLAVTNGTVASLSGSDKNYTALVTPTSNGLVSMQLPASAVQDSIGNYNTVSSLFSVTFDNIKPTLLISSTAPNPTRLNIPVAFTFSKPVTGFTISDITVTNGTLSTFNGSNKNYSVTVIPTNQGTVSISVADNAAVDVSLNGNAASNLLVIKYDTKSPAPSIISGSDTPTADAIVVITVIFSKPVTGFTLSDIATSNCTVSDFSGSGDTYTLNLHTVSIGVVSLSIPASACIDIAGNGNTASTLTTRYRGDDYTKPVINITSAAPNPSAIATIPVKFTLSETALGFTSSDITVTNGSLANFSGSGLSYTANLTAASYGLVTLSINDAAVIDIAGNTSDPSQFTFTYQQITSPTLVITASASSNLSSIPVYFNFSTSVTGFTVDDIIITNGTLSGFAGSGNNYTVYASPSSEGLVTIAVPGNAAFDASSSGNLQSNTANIIYDIQQPTASITSTAANPSSDKTITVTITFSEPVVGFGMNNLLTTNASLSNFSGSGTTYTVQLTAVDEGLVQLILQHEQVSDPAGNTAIASSFSIQYEVFVTGFLENDNLKDITIYPNPSSGIITIDHIMLSGSTDITVTSTIGVEVYKDDMQASEQLRVLDVSYLPNGIYTVTLKNDKQVKDMLIVIQH